MTVSAMPGQRGHCGLKMPTPSKMRISSTCEWVIRSVIGSGHATPHSNFPFSNTVPIPCLKCVRSSVCSEGAALEIGSVHGGTPGMQLQQHAPECVGQPTCSMRGIIDCTRASPNFSLYMSSLFTPWCARQGCAVRVGRGTAAPPRQSGQLLARSPPWAPRRSAETDAS